MNHGKNLLESHKYNGINATLDVIQMVIDEAIDTNADDYQKFLVSWLQAAIVFGIAWGLVAFSMTNRENNLIISIKR